MNGLFFFLSTYAGNEIVQCQSLEPLLGPNDKQLHRHGHPNPQPSPRIVFRKSLAFLVFVWFLGTMKISPKIFTGEIRRLKISCVRSACYFRGSPEKNQPFFFCFLHLHLHLHLSFHLFFLLHLHLPFEMSASS